MDPAPCLVLDRVSRDFAGLKAVDRVSLAVRTGERRAVIGPNGAGKTTLFNLISGELPATEGTVALFGVDITRLSSYQRAARGIGRTFQIMSLFPELTVLENLLVACEALDRRKFRMYRSIWSHRDLVANASGLLEAFELSPFANERVRHLSYGDQRKLDIALAMAGRPRLLLLDEPMAGLSPADRGALLAMLGKLDQDTAILLIDHDMDIALGFAETVTVLHHGRVLFDGDAEQAGANRDVQQIYLGAPRPSC